MTEQPYDSTPPERSPRYVRWWWDYPLVVFFILFWLLPMFWMGMTRKKIYPRFSAYVANKVEKFANSFVAADEPDPKNPGNPTFEQYEKRKANRELANRIRKLGNLPSELTHLHNASCLFTNSVRNWSTNHVQGSHDGRRWFTLRDEQYSPMKPFGHRARVDRMLSDIGAYKRYRSKQIQADEMCQWYRWRYSQLNPTAEPLVAVRLVGVLYKVGDPYIATPEGRWVKRIPEDVPDRKPYIIYTKRFRKNDPVRPAPRTQAEKDERQREKTRRSQTDEIEECCDEF